MNHGVLLYVLVSLRRNERPPTRAANHFCHWSFIVSTNDFGICFSQRFVSLSSFLTESRYRMSTSREKLDAYCARNVYDEKQNKRDAYNIGKYELSTIRINVDD